LRQLDQEVFGVVGAKGRDRRVAEIADWLKGRGPSRWRTASRAPSTPRPR